MKDKLVLVTGGSSGIGRAAALAFARKGAKTVIAARGAERGHRMAREIEAGGARALFVRADVSQAADSSDRSCADPGGRYQLPRSPDLPSTS